MIVIRSIRSFGKGDTFKCRRRVTKKYCRKLDGHMIAPEAKALYTKREVGKIDKQSVQDRENAAKTAIAFPNAEDPCFDYFLNAFFQEVPIEKGEGKLSPWPSMITGLCIQNDDLLQCSLTHSLTPFKDFFFSLVLCLLLTT